MTEHSPTPTVSLVPSKSNIRDSTSKSFQGNEELLKKINSPDLTLYSCIEMICKYADNIGIHYYLCQRLLTFPHSELQFYIPQLVQILLTIETESMALEELLQKLRNENLHFALLTFWQLQALIVDLSTDPDSYGFQVARRVLNNLQSVLFNPTLISDDDDATNSSTLFFDKNSKFHENVPPAIIYSSMIFGCMAMPQLAIMTQPLVESQGKRQKSYVFKLAKGTMKSLKRNLNFKGSFSTHNHHNSSHRNYSSKNYEHNSYQNNTYSRNNTNGLTSNSTSSRVDLVDSTISREDILFRKQKKADTNLNFDIVDNIGDRVFQERISNSIKLPKRRTRLSSDLNSSKKQFENLTINDNKYQNNNNNNFTDFNNNNNNNEEVTQSAMEYDDVDSLISKDDTPISLNADQVSASMPNLHDLPEVRPSLSSFNSADKSGTNNVCKQTSSTMTGNSKGSKQLQKSIYKQNKLPNATSRADNDKLTDLTKLSTTTKIRMLKANYFRHETQFAIALETISQRLSQVPTEARLSALRAELSLMNRDLPAEVDIPTLLPHNKKGKLHKLVTITANEAQVLNSAEKVPYLLLIEYLRDEFDLDPTSEKNEEILRNRAGNSNNSFDLNYLSKNKKNSDMINDKDGVNILHPEGKTSGTYQDSGDDESAKKVTSEGSDGSASAYSDYSAGGMKEVDLGDVSMIRVKNQTDAHAFRGSLVLNSATQSPIIPSSSSSDKKAPDLSFVSNFEEIINQNRRHFPRNMDKTVELADQMRISAVMLAQLDQSPQELSDAANQIRSKIIASMQEVQDKFGYKDLENIHGMAGERKLENDMMTGGIDSSYLGEDWSAKKDRIRKTSKYGHLANWDLCSVIAKSGDDLRQEAFACQIIQAMAQIWSKEKVDVWVKKMRILITSATTGLVETITNAMSVHSIKKALTKKMVQDGDLDEKNEIASLRDHYLRAFGDPNGFRFKRAQDNFACSLAAYSVIGYLLQIKDRHNGNIMIDNEGHVCHIDFGFMLSNSPGAVGFEAAPFKLTWEYVELLDGVDGAAFKKFKRLTRDAFKSVRRHADQIVSMCEIMQKDNMQPCFNAGDQTSVQLQQRFQLDLSDKEIDDFVENFLIGKSLGSMFTRLYDQFQLVTQGIYS